MMSFYDPFITVAIPQVTMALRSERAMVRLRQKYREGVHTLPWLENYTCFVLRASWFYPYATFNVLKQCRAERYKKTSILVLQNIKLTAILDLDQQGTCCLCGRTLIID